jgi:hypothetical protein
VLPLLGFHINVSGSGPIPLGIVLIAIGIVLLSIWACVLTAKYARRKGFPFAPILIACLFIGFPIVLLVVALVPARQPPIGSMPPHWRKW